MSGRHASHRLEKYFRIVAGPLVAGPLTESDALKSKRDGKNRLELGVAKSTLIR